MRRSAGLGGDKRLRVSGRSLHSLLFSQEAGMAGKTASRASLAPLASFLKGSLDGGERLQIVRRSLRSLLFSQEAGMAIQGCKSCVARSARFCSRRKLGWRGRLRVSGRWLRSLLSRRLASFLGAVCACGCVRLRALCVLFALFSLQGHAHVSSRRPIVPADLSERGMLSRTALPRRLGVSADLSALNI